MKLLKSMISLLLMFVGGTAFSQVGSRNIEQNVAQPDLEPLKLKVYDYRNGAYKKIPSLPGHLSLKEIADKVRLRDDEVIVIYNTNSDRDQPEPRNIQTLGK